MPVPARTPVIVGRAQIVDTEPDLDNPTDPIQLMTRSAAAAVADAGIDASSIDLVGVVAGLFRHPNPGRAIGDAIGIPASATSVLTVCDQPAGLSNTGTANGPRRSSNSPSRIT